MGSGPSAPASPLARNHTDILTLDQNPSRPDNRTMDESELDSPIPKFDTSSWSDDEDENENDVDTLRRDLDSALQSSPKQQPKTSAKSDASGKSKHSNDSRFLLDSAEDFVDRKDFPETYAQKIQRVRLEDQQPAMLVHDHVMVRRDPDDWEVDEAEILDFDVTKFKAVNQTQQTFITQSFESTDVRSSTPRSSGNVEYDPFEEEIMAAIERDF